MMYVAQYRRRWRVLFYWCYMWLRWKNLMVEFVVDVSRFANARAFGERPYAGIRVLAYPPNGIDALCEVIAALELVRLTDARRFGRIEQYVKSIVLANWNPKNLGTYRALCK